MTARRYVVKRRTHTAHRSITSTSSSSTSQKTSKPIPEKPRVDRGPFAVKEFRSRERAVARFFITQSRGTACLRRGWVPGNWWVVDAETWTTAAGTKKEGYRTEEEAKRIARRYRDEYGAYARSPF